MVEIYNMRVGDLLYRTQNGRSIVGLIYKTTAKYVYYAICATIQSGEGPAFITRDHKISKKRLYEAISEESIKISYAKGVKRRKKIKA